MKNERLGQMRQMVKEKVATINTFIQRVWFKTSLLLLVAFVFSQKDFSFYINMNAGDGGKEISPEKAAFRTLPGEQQVYKDNILSTPGSVADNKNKRPEMTSAEQKAAAKRLGYVERFAHVARSEMIKFGIPASITLAQGILESNAGESRLATKNNNHFGIKCFSSKCGKGHCSNFEDDHHKDFFKIYDSAWSSYRDHSQLLTSKHYRHLLKLERTDYRGWAKGLEKAGYATAKNYGDKLIRLIETLDLVAYDEP